MFSAHLCGCLQQQGHTYINRTCLQLPLRWPPLYKRNTDFAGLSMAWVLLWNLPILVDLHLEALTSSFVNREILVYFVGMLWGGNEKTQISSDSGLEYICRLTREADFFMLPLLSCHGRLWPGHNSLPKSWLLGKTELVISSLIQNRVLWGREVPAQVCEFVCRSLNLKMQGAMSEM